MNQESFIYKFLLSPTFRKWRYLTLIVFFTIVSLNQAVVGYKEFIPQMGYNLYWILAITILVYIATVFLVLKKIEKYLLAGRYTLFVIYVILCAVLFLSISNLTYDTYVDGYDLFSKSVLLDNISAFVVYLLCISGMFIPVFLKNWMISNQQLNDLKIKQKSSQVEQFKEQINPASFFKILNRSKSYVKTEPERASAMLMKFGQLLRYQLYDSNRTQVLLSSEISFVRNFLELEKLHASMFDYELDVEGNIHGIFVPPSVLLPYVQNVINTFDDEAKFQKIKIQINMLEETILVILRISDIGNGKLLQKELSKVRDRLNSLYKERYTLTVSTDKHTDEVEIMLALNK